MKIKNIKNQVIKIIEADLKSSTKHWERLLEYVKEAIEEETLRGKSKFVIYPVDINIYDNTGGLNCIMSENFEESLGKKVYEIEII